MSTVLSEKSVCVRIADRLAKSIGSRRYSMWFDRSVRMDYHDRQHCLELAVPNQFVAQWVDRNFKDELQHAVRDELDASVSLQFRVRSDLFDKDSVADPSGVAATDGSKQTGLLPAGDRRRSVEPRGRVGLRHQLEDFVVGSCNELAYAAVNRVVEDLDATINPLFVHGGCGLGKTHLLQGLCRKMLVRQPGGRILYTTGEQFTNDFLTAMRTNKLDAFRKRIRRLDLLAVDDIHFLANKQATQQEFLHSFDAIELGGARVVLASDSHPTLIRQFKETLVSRCVRGMVVQMHQPDADTRAKIIRALAQRRGLSLLDSAVDVLANRCVGSIREIEGALTKLHALAWLPTRRQAADQVAGGRVPAPIGNTLVDRLFEDETASPRRRAIQFETILNTVVEQLKIDRAHVLGAGRHHQVVLARALVIYLARQLTMMSYPEIAAAMGRRTHSTIITAAQRVTKQLAANPTVVLSGTMEQVSLVELVENLKRSVVRA